MFSILVSGRLVRGILRYSRRRIWGNIVVATSEFSTSKRNTIRYSCSWCWSCQSSCCLHDWSSSFSWKFRWWWQVSCNIPSTSIVPLSFLSSFPVYFSWPSTEGPSWIYLGKITNTKPSAIFKINKTKGPFESFLRKWLKLNLLIRCWIKTGISTDIVQCLSTSHSGSNGWFVRY